MPLGTREQIELGKSKNSDRGGDAQWSLAFPPPTSRLRNAVFAAVRDSPPLACFWRPSRRNASPTRHMAAVNVQHRCSTREYSTTNARKSAPP